jgi:hypothetical protein
MKGEVIMNVRTSLSALALAMFLVLGSVPASAEIQGRSTVTVVNRSIWAIHHIYMSSFYSSSWGRDMLGEYILYPNQQFELRTLGCDLYDIKLVDQDGDTCVLRKINICRTRQQWVINNDTLLLCEATTR